MKILKILIPLFILSIFYVENISAATCPANNNYCNNYKCIQCQYKVILDNALEPVTYTYKVAADGKGSACILEEKKEKDESAWFYTTSSITGTDFLNANKDNIECPKITASKNRNDREASRTDVNLIKSTNGKTNDVELLESKDLNTNKFKDSNIVSGQGSGTCRIKYVNNEQGFNSNIIATFDGTNVTYEGEKLTFFAGTTFKSAGDVAANPAKYFGDNCKNGGTVKVYCKNKAFHTEYETCVIADENYTDADFNGISSTIESNTSGQTITACCMYNGNYYCKDKKQCPLQRYNNECDNGNLCGKVVEAEEIEPDFGNVCKDGGCDIDIKDICEKPNVARTLKFVGLLVNIVKIIVPAIIIIMGIINLFNIITSGNDVADAKKYAKNIATRVLIGVLIFLIPGLINFVYDEVMKITGISNSGKDKLSNCVNCILDVDSCDVND